MLQALAQLVHFVADFAHESVSIGRDAAVAAVDFLQQAERLLPEHDEDRRTIGEDIKGQEYRSMFRAGRLSTGGRGGAKSFAAAAWDNMLCVIVFIFEK